MIEINASALQGLARLNKNIKEKALKRATFATIKKTTKEAKKISTGFLSKRVNIKKSGAKDGDRLTPGLNQMVIIKESKVTANSPINEMIGTVLMQNKPMSMIHFVVGSKFPRPQKGIKISSRVKVKVKVYKGRATTLGRGFIAKAKNGYYQLFNRSKSTGKLRKYATPSIYKMFKNDDVMVKKTKTHVTKYYQQTFAKEFISKLRLLPKFLR
ncbi:MAG: hypothetical protein BWY19_00760 [bacterium ADurb.Bin212]|nr:MAG: hypothetical protein BWY19_00760 [bacterium ADurb.Bin212]